MWAEYKKAGIEILEQKAILAGTHPEKQLSVHRSTSPTPLESTGNAESQALSDPHLTRNKISWQSD